MKTNFHTHTWRCGHAVGNESEYATAAMHNGLEQLGFSDHAPYKVRTAPSAMPFSQLSEYVSGVNSLKEQCAQQMSIKLGLEIEYFHSELQYYEELFSNYGMDYLVLGQHIITDGNGREKIFYRCENTEDYVFYAKSLAEGISTGYFKFASHPDSVLANVHPWDDNCERLCDIIINATIKYDFILEINCNGFRKFNNGNFPSGWEYRYPNDRFWEKVKGTNIRVVVGADSHDPQEIWDDNVAEGYRYAEERNLNIIHTIF